MEITSRLDSILSYTALDPHGTGTPTILRLHIETVGLIQKYRMAAHPTDLELAELTNKVVLSGSRVGSVLVQTMQYVPGPLHDHNQKLSTEGSTNMFPAPPGTTTDVSKLDYLVFSVQEGRHVLL